MIGRLQLCEKVQMTEKSMYYYGGTLVLVGVERDEPGIPPEFRWSHGKWRTEGYRYADLLSWLHATNIKDTVPRWQALNYTLYDGRLPHDYQIEALSAWQKAGKRGSIVIPTGSGKSYIAIRALHQVNRSAVVVVPTIDLLHQWFRLLEHAFHTDIGVFYGSDKVIRPVTVVTYSSFPNFMAEYGHSFYFFLADETHHLSSPTYGEGALMAPAIARLGLTATYPSDEEQQGGRWQLTNLLGGPIVFSLSIDDLAGEQLAAYRTQIIRVNLTTEERSVYSHETALCMEFVRGRNLLQEYKAGWLSQLQKLSAKDRAARAAFLARQRAERLLAGCQGKLQAVDELLREHMTEQALIFTESNEVAYRIAHQYLIPIISHHTKAPERKAILDAFQEKKVSCIITSRVLEEGIDVPSAKVAIVLGGSTGARQYIQRLGRILRKAENKQAVLYEVLVRGTSEEGKVQRRHAAARRQGERDVHR
jgi:superfamily II DNA or RNA helicase